MFFIKTIRELKALRKENAELKEAVKDHEEEIVLYEKEWQRIEHEQTVRHFHINAKMLAADLIKRAAQKDIAYRGKTITVCLVSLNELRVIANSKIK
jgi:cell division septum initiation protein DivIVA